MTLRHGLFIAPLVLAAACGGGGSAPAVRTAALDGLVFEVDGQTLDRSGVEVNLLETGDTQVTGADGRFTFRSIPAGAATLRFGSTAVALAHDDDGTDDREPGDDRSGRGGGGDGLEDEDHHGNPRMGGVEAGDVLRVRCSVRDGEVDEFSVSGAGRLRAEARLTRAPGSPDPDVQGKVKVEQRADREKFTVEAERLAPGTVVEFFLDDPADATGFVSLGTVAALADGEAELERNTKDGDVLPLGAASAGDLAGFRVEVRLAGTGELLLTGEVPGLPDAVPDLGGAPLPEGRARGRAELTPFAAGVEGHVEIRRRPEKGLQRFKMEAEHLAPGTRVAFLIDDGTGTFVRLASAAADAEGEAEISTNDGLPLPLGARDVEELVGHGVRVVRDDGTGELLLAGTVPPLVAD